MAGCHNSHTGSHRSRGAWIEIFYTNIKSYSIMGRIAHAVRGLKLFVAVFFQQVHLSHRSRGAWIEIGEANLAASNALSHRSRGAWIEIGSWASYSLEKKGRIAHAVRGLKSCLFLPFHYPLFVASLTRCVD